MWNQDTARRGLSAVGGGVNIANPSVRVRKSANLRLKA